MAQYDVVLVRRIPVSSGAPSFIQVAPLNQWTALSWRDDVVGDGQAQVTMSVDLLEASVKSALIDLSLSPCELWIYRDAEQRFAGPVMNHSVADRAVTVYALGLSAYLGYMARDTNYNPTGAAIDQATIVKTLIDDYQAQTYGHFGLDTSTLTATGVTVPLVLAGKELQNLSSVIRTLGARSNGFDLQVLPATRQVKAWYPRRGQDLSSAVFMYARAIGKPNYSQSVAPGHIASDVAVTGTSKANLNFTSSAPNTSLRASFGRVMATASYSDVPDQATLDTYAAKLADDLDSPLHSVSPGLMSIPGFSVDDFGAGDFITYEADAGLGTQTLVRRVYRLSVVVAQGGDEQLGVEFQ